MTDTSQKPWEAENAEITVAFSCGGYSYTLRVAVRKDTPSLVEEIQAAMGVHEEMVAAVLQHAP